MKLLGLGSEFDGGVVVRITSTDIVLDDGRRVSHADVEAQIAR